MKSKISVSLLVIALLATGFCWGTFYGQETFEPQVEYVEVEVSVIKAVDHYIEVPVEVVKEIEVEKLIELREFASLEELKDWLL